MDNKEILAEAIRIAKLWAGKDVLKLNTCLSVGRLYR